MQEFLKKYASPLSVIGSTLIILAIIEWISELVDGTIHLGQNFGFLIRWVLWGAAIVLLIFRAVVISIFKKKKTQLIVEAILLVIVIAAVTIFGA